MGLVRGGGRGGLHLLDSFLQIIELCIEFHVDLLGCSLRGSVVAGDRPQDEAAVVGEVVVLDDTAWSVLLTSRRRRPSARYITPAKRA